MYVDKENTIIMMVVLLFDDDYDLDLMTIFRIKMMKKITVIGTQTSKI